MCRSSYAGAANNNTLPIKMIEPSPAPADDDDAMRARAPRRVEREFEIRRVLGCGMVLDRRARRGDDVGIGRVEVAYHEINLQAERRREVNTRIGGDDEVRVRQTFPYARQHQVAARKYEHDTRLSHRPPFAGITRSRFKGSAAVRAELAQPPSQPGSPELPMGLSVCV